MADLTGMMQAAAGGAGGGGGGGNYIAVGHSGAPYFTLLDHTIPGTVTLAATYTLAGTANGVDFSPDAKYIAIGHNEAPYLTILDHTSPGSISLASTYTLVTTGQGVEFSSDGNYLASGYASAPRFTLFNFSSGTVTLAATYALVGNPTGAACVSFSPDNQYVAVGHSSTPNFTLLDHTSPGSISLASTYTAGGTRYAAVFSRSGSYIGIGGSGTEYFTLLNHSVGSVSFAATYTNIPSFGWIFGVSFSLADEYIALASINATYSLILLDHTTPGSLSLATTYTLAGGGSANDCKFSPDGNYIALVGTATPYFTLLNHASGSVSLAATYTIGSTGVNALAVAFS